MAQRGTGGACGGARPPGSASPELAAVTQRMTTTVAADVPAEAVPRADPGRSGHADTAAAAARGPAGNPSPLAGRVLPLDAVAETSEQVWSRPLLRRCRAMLQLLNSAWQGCMLRLTAALRWTVASTRVNVTGSTQAYCGDVLCDPRIPLAASQ